MADTTMIENKWFVVVSKTNYYKKVNALLEKLGVAFYLPIQRQLHYWSDRKKWVNVPILSPYIFLFTNEADRRLIFQSTNFFSFLKRNGKLATVAEGEIEKLRLLCNYSTTMKMEGNFLKKGDHVEVTGGPFTGMTGFTLQENGRHRFLVQIAALGQFASVEIDGNYLKHS